MKPTTARLNQLQFLRFMAFFSVFMFHFSSYRPMLFPASAAADAAVAFFIVLSGFCSGYSAYEQEIPFSLKNNVSYIWRKLKGEVTRKKFLCFSAAEIFIAVFCFLWLFVPSPEWLARSVRWFLPFCIALIVFAFGTGVLSKLFSLRPLQYLGDISYECFLLHQIVIVYLYRFCEDAGLGITGGTLGFSLLCITVTVLLSMLFSRQKLRKGTSQP